MMMKKAQFNLSFVMCAAVRHGNNSNTTWNLLPGDGTRFI